MKIQTKKHENICESLSDLSTIYSEIFRRKNSALSKYNTGKIIHKKQLEFHKSSKRNRWVFGGNRSGKTECGAVETVWLARGIHPYRENKKDVFGWVVSLSTKVQKEVAQEKILKYLDREYISEIIMNTGKKSSPEYGVIDTIVVKNSFGGFSKISFKSCEEGREKFQGTSLDFVWFDEEPPEDIYNECKMRVLDKCGDIFGTMTPLKGQTYIYDQIYLNSQNDPEVYSIFMEWADNPYLSQDELKRLTSSMSEEELISRRYGKFLMNNKGMVYKEFDPNIHVIEPFEIPREYYDNISIDPGLNNPLSAHFYACDYDGNIFVIAEHYEAQKDVAYHASKLKEIAKNLGWHFRSDGKLEALIDSAANQRTLSGTKSVTELFFENGIAVNPKVNKDLFTGINRVKSYLKNSNGEAKLFIFSNCTNLIREIKSYYWGKGENPIKYDDHCLDDLRYYIMSRPENQKPKTEKTEIQKNKEKLYKNILRNYHQ